MNEFAGIFFELTEKQLNKLVEIVETFIHLNIDELDYRSNEESDVIRIISNIREAKELKESLLASDFEELANGDFGYKYIITHDFRCIVRDVLKDDILNCQEELELNPKIILGKEDPFSDSLWDRYLPNNVLAYRIYQEDYMFLKQIFDAVCLAIGRDGNIPKYHQFKDVCEVLNLEDNY